MKRYEKRKTADRPSIVRFELCRPSARRVCLAGSFNGWDPDVMPMTASGHGTWARELALGPGRYEYCFVVDGEWTKDPGAAESVANPFGGFNSVLTIGEKDKSEASSSARPVN